MTREWTERLISAVEAHPNLYDLELSAYSDRNIREETWIKITKSLVDNWLSMTEEDGGGNWLFILPKFG